MSILRFFFSFFLNLVCLYCLGQNQTNLTKVSISPIEFDDDLKKYGKEIYCSGHTYQTDNYDGYATYAYLNKYDKELNLIWSIKIDSSPKNLINSITKYNNKIYALISYGKTTNSTSDIHLSLYIISLDGQILNKVYIGKSYAKPTNILFDQNDLWFCHSESNSIYYNNHSITPVIVKYNIKSGIIEKTKGALNNVYPYKILKDKSRIYVTGKRMFPVEGKFIPEQEQLLLILNQKKLMEKVLESSNEEYFLDSYIKNNELVILTTFPDSYKNKVKYLTFRYLNLSTNKLNTKSIYYDKMNLDDISFTTHSTESSTWLKVKKKNGLKYFINLGSKGNILNEKLISINNNSVEQFIIDDKIILRIIDKTLLRLE